MVLRYLCCLLLSILIFQVSCAKKEDAADAVYSEEAVVDTTTVIATKDSLESRMQQIEDSLAAVTEAEEELLYLEKGYYDNIPTEKIVQTSREAAYAEMMTRYQNKDFEYIESISDKLNFLDIIAERFYKFFENLFPEIDTNPGDWFYTALGIIGGLIVVFLVYKMFFAGKVFIRHAKEEGEEESEIAFVERNLEQVDLRNYLSEALAKKDYALAIRYQHLMNVKLLSKKGIIRWDRTKTNRELLLEMADFDLRTDFIACTDIFDRVWFGDFQINESNYASLTRVFEQFQKRWG